MIRKTLRSQTSSLVLLGLLFEGGGLALYMIAAQKWTGSLPKDLVMSFTFLACASLLWRHICNSTHFKSALIAAVVLSFDYIVGLHLVGLLLFRGLIRDYIGYAGEYAVSVIEVFCFVTLFYVVLASSMYLVAKRMFSVRASPRK